MANRSLAQVLTLRPGPGGPVWLIEFRAMGSPCRLHLAGVALPRAQALAELALAEVQRIEQAWSRYQDDSVVSRINRAAGTGKVVAVDAETAHLLDFADQLWRASEGRFDITSGVLRRAWNFRQASVPDAARLAQVCSLIGWADVAWNGEFISLPRTGMEIDFGGLGKEYAVDRVATLLIEAGQRSGVVNLGGDLRVLGPRPDGQPWQMAVAHPRQPGENLVSWPLLEGALATSGDYERCIDVAGRRYAHILDPRTGWPVSDWQSISVFAPACLAAGALCTVAMLSGPAAPDFLREQGVDFVACDAHGHLFTSEDTRCDLRAAC